jgi:hypothetical protein
MLELRRQAVSDGFDGPLMTNAAADQPPPLGRYHAGSRLTWADTGDTRVAFGSAKFGGLMGHVGRVDRFGGVRG